MHHMRSIGIARLSLLALAIALPGVSADPSPALVGAVQREAQRLREPADLDRLVAAAGEASIVLIGEASHGTQEFYDTRALITRRLIEEKGFVAVAAEADWPDAYAVNRHVRSADAESAPEQALSAFERFPRWMWRNTVVRDFAGWLRERNQPFGSGEQAGFYGMDLYSLFRSQQEVIRYLDSVDPDAASRARDRYACFQNFNDDPELYAYSVWLRIAPSCEAAAIDQFNEMLARTLPDLAEDIAAQDELFNAQQNARVVKNGEEYYRTMYTFGVSGWNLRDRHMAETLEALQRHLTNRTGRPKILVWAHNSHLGDARATEMGAGGELNVGQLVREIHGQDAFSIGFTTYTGTVTAANNWGGPARVMNVRPALEDSVEAAFHATGIDRFILTLRNSPAAAELLRRNLLERAIGVIYLPQTERQSHYFSARVADQFDAVIHIDRTRALEPLDAEPAVRSSVADVYAVAGNAARATRMTFPPRIF
jgi:erythromycin esterase-like protein